MEEVSVGEDAYRRIRADIVFGRLAPGQRLGLEGMRAAYGAGVSTLRELLSRLSSEGLVTAEGQRGFEVAPVSAAELREIAALRLLLETHALEQSFAAGGLEWESDVVAAHHRLAAMERLLLSGDTGEAERWKRYDWEFHHALVAACGSRVLLQAHAAIYDRYLRYQMVAAVFRGAVAAEEHRRLLDAALARDVAAARTLLAEHIDGCVAQVLGTGALDAFRPRPLLASAGGQGAARRRRAGAEPAATRGAAKRRREGKAAG